LIEWLDPELRNYGRSSNPTCTGKNKFPNACCSFSNNWKWSGVLAGILDFR
jgi:hypothetical protein